MQKDYYTILDIPRDASDADIKKAFRLKAKECHPEFNNTPEGEKNFVLVNEAYEILIHRKTREIYEGVYPEHYPSFQHWLAVARERAVIHSRLPYSEFVRTKFYHSTASSPYFLYIFELLLAFVLITIPYTLMISENNKPVGIASLFIALPAGIFLLVQASSGFSSIKKYKKEIKKKDMKKAAKGA